MALDVCWQSATGKVMLWESEPEINVQKVQNHQQLENSYFINTGSGYSISAVVHKYICVATHDRKVRLAGRLKLK